MRERGAIVTLISGPTHLPTPHGVMRITVKSAQEMLKATEKTLPADGVICVAAVTDWKIENPSTQKIKKQKGSLPQLKLSENPDILKTISTHKKYRPALVVGFAAETDHLIEYAQNKLTKKGCDWIIANDISGDIMGGDENQVHLVTKEGVEHWPLQSKLDVARQLTKQIEEYFK